MSPPVAGEQLDLEALENDGDNVRQHSLDPSSDCAKAADAIDALISEVRRLREAESVADAFYRLTVKQRDDAWLEVERLREAGERVRQAWNDPRHDFGHLPHNGCAKIGWMEKTGHYETTQPCSCGYDALRAAVEGLR